MGASSFAVGSQALTLNALVGCTIVRIYNSRPPSAAPAPPNVTPAIPATLDTHQATPAALLAVVALPAAPLHSARDVPVGRVAGAADPDAQALSTRTHDPHLVGVMPGSSGNTALSGAV